jgi:hypothetical protein
VIFGDAADWLDEFKGYDARFIERLCEILPNALLALGPNPVEDDITHNLRLRFDKDAGIRRLFYSWETQFEPPYQDATGKYVRDGIIDLVLFWSQEPTPYLAYEAKRLSVQMPSGFRSLAGEYLKEGLSRYATEKYAEGLPFGGMLGYVLDGDLPTASNRIGVAISRKVAELKLRSGPEALPAIATALRFQTTHTRSNGTSISIVHSLLDCRS